MRFYLIKQTTAPTQNNTNLNKKNKKNKNRHNITHFMKIMGWKEGESLEGKKR